MNKPDDAVGAAHVHRAEYPSRCEGCEHLAADLVSRMPPGLQPVGAVAALRAAVVAYLNGPSSGEANRRARQDLWAALTDTAEAARAEAEATGRFRPCAQCGLSPARHNGNLGRVGDPAYAGHEYR